MNYPSWDPQQTQFLLGEQYSLERADPTLFAIHFTTAELAQNVWFRQSWDQLVGIEGWTNQEGAKADEHNPCSPQEL